MRSFSTALALASLLPTTLAEYRPTEHVVLMDCGFNADGDSSSQWLFYYPGIPWESNFKYKDPEMLQQVPWDGAYPWRENVPAVTMSNGDVFSFGIGPEIPDIIYPPHKYAGIGSSILQASNSFMCYGWHERKAYYLKDEAQTECGTAYICHHQWESSSPIRAGRYKHTSPDGGSGDGYERKTTLTIDASTTEVFTEASDISSTHPSLVSPIDAFSTLSEAFEGKGCKSKRYTISDLCSIGFECELDGQGEDLAGRQEAIAALIQKVAGDLIVDTEYRTTKYTTAHGVPTYFKGYVYPQTGGLVIEAWKKGEEGTGSFVQARVTFDIQCKSAAWVCRPGCSDIVGAMVGLGYSSKVVPETVFGTLSAGACDNVCT